MIIESLCADDTFAFGKKLGEAAEPGTVYTLVGDLGVGKLDNLLFGVFRLR